MGGYESWVDRQIREAQERGEFDDLPGSGKPIPNRNELHDENWWIKQWVQREQDHRARAGVAAHPQGGRGAAADHRHAAR